MTPEAITRTIAMLDDGEEVSVLIGTGPRPSELKLGPSIQKRLRLMLRQEMQRAAERMSPNTNSKPEEN